MFGCRETTSCVFYIYIYNFTAWIPHQFSWWKDSIIKIILMRGSYFCPLLHVIYRVLKRADIGSVNGRMSRLVTVSADQTHWGHPSHSVMGYMVWWMNGTDRYQVSIVAFVWTLSVYHFMVHSVILLAHHTQTGLPRSHEWNVTHFSRFCSLGQRVSFDLGDDLVPAKQQYAIN